MVLGTSQAAPYPAAGRTLRLGFVGGGRGALVSDWHKGGARLSDRWDIVAGALSSDPDVARASGEDWGLDPERTYTDFTQMAVAEAARPDGIDAVAIVTPNHLHRAPAEAFMAAGIDVICDKPLCNEIADADALIAQQAETGVVFALTHPYAYHAMVRQAADMVASGDLGTIRQVHVEYMQDWATGTDPEGKGVAWRRDPATAGRASVTGDIGTHALHLLELVACERVTDLRAEFHVCGAPKAMEDTAFLSLRLGGRIPGTMMVTQTAPGNYCGLRLRVYGDKGGLHWDQERPEYLHFAPLGRPPQVLVRGHGSGMTAATERMVTLPRGHGEALSDAWANLYREAAVAIEARRDNRVLPDGLLMLPGLADGAHGVRFVHAAADSHEDGGTWQSLT